MGDEVAAEVVVVWAAIVVGVDMGGAIGTAAEKRKRK